jgi:hypothetical protein
VCLAYPHAHYLNFNVQVLQCGFLVMPLPCDDRKPLYGAKRFSDLGTQRVSFYARKLPQCDVRVRIDILDLCK